MKKKLKKYQGTEPKQKTKKKGKTERTRDQVKENERNKKKKETSKPTYIGRSDSRNN